MSATVIPFPQPNRKVVIAGWRNHWTVSIEPLGEYRHLGRLYQAFSEAHAHADRVAEEYGWPVELLTTPDGEAPRGPAGPGPAAA